MIHPRTFSLLIPIATRHHAAGWLTGAILLCMSRYGPEAERESSRTAVVLLSLLILTVLGALLGYILGKRDIDADKSLSGDGKSPTASARTSAGASAAPVAEPCPDFIGKAAQARKGNTKLPLVLVLYIRTDRNSEVWICRESSGLGLWYQGHDKRQGYYPDEIPVEGDNGLLLSTVTAAGDGFLATNEETQYRVSRKELKVSGKQNYTANVVQSAP
ncbi:hypothetical protein KZZ52_53050 [Dactylosporangium sp. AC04546]|uniref:hypothetical protein n=1 Tax=Dactylosporangium sp. AC04546 TaxID=2862460 RepID=UPI001EDD6F55|nr:hypothetical protein [Dactylosporangium sp. AC04546]WVK82584.1 hypothetical protein KZZ52_53050 [Dactylosporangium sp. AC04546]